MFLNKVTQIKQPGGCLQEILYTPIDLEVKLLDGSSIFIGNEIGLSTKTTVNQILDYIFGELDLSVASTLEKYQFGLSYKHRLEEKREKRLSRRQRDKNIKSYVVKQDIQWRYLQKGKSLGDYQTDLVENVVYLVVQYFTPVPFKIDHRNIKIQYYLQLRSLLLSGELPLESNDLTVTISALMTQIEFGDADHSIEDDMMSVNADISQNRTYEFLHFKKYAQNAIGLYQEYQNKMLSYAFNENLYADFIGKIYHEHKKLIGITHTEAIDEFLYITSKLGYYGMKRFRLSEDGRQYIGIGPSGISLFMAQSRRYRSATRLSNQNSEKLEKVHHFSWLKILNIKLAKPDGLTLYYADTCFSNNFLKIDCFNKHLARRLHRLCLEFHRVYTISLVSNDSKKPKIASTRNTISRFDRLSFSDKVPIKPENFIDTNRSQLRKTIGAGKRNYSLRNKSANSLSSHSNSSSIEMESFSNSATSSSTFSTGFSIGNLKYRRRTVSCSRSKSESRPSVSSQCSKESVLRIETQEQFV